MLLVEVSEREVLKRGKWLTVMEHTVEIPGPTTTTINDWTWVNSPSFVNVACVTNTGQWLLFYQPKSVFAVLRQSATQTRGIPCVALGMPSMSRLAAIVWHL